MESYRRGYEFPLKVKRLARERAGGFCEFPEGCDNPNNGTIDHLTAICLARRIGMDRKVIRSLANAQCLCDEHDREKQLEERWIKQQLDTTGILNPFINRAMI